MLTALKNGMKVVGAKQTTRALNEGRAAALFLARDADPRITEPFTARCAEAGVPVTWVGTMKELGAACGIAVGSAVAALVK